MHACTFHLKKNARKSSVLIQIIQMYTFSPILLGLLLGGYFIYWLLATRGHRFFECNLRSRRTVSKLNRRKVGRHFYPPPLHGPFATCQTINEFFSAHVCLGLSVCWQTLQLPAFFPPALGSQKIWTFSDYFSPISVMMESWPLVLPDVSFCLIATQSGCLELPFCRSLVVSTSREMSVLRPILGLDSRHLFCLSAHL